MACVPRYGAKLHTQKWLGPCASFEASKGMGQAGKGSKGKDAG